MRRRAAVSGRFYLGGRKALYEHVAGLTDPRAEKQEAKAILSPHAGYIYSGAVAGAVYSRIVFPESFVLLGPNHTGLGARVAIMPRGTWETPLGDVAVDAALAEAVMRHAPLVTEDAHAHHYEHSLEVQIPFMQYFSTGVKIVPITVMTASPGELKALGEGIARAVLEAGYKVVVAVSTDMSHFIPEAEARKKDMMAIEKVLALDPEGLYAVVREHGITMCGYQPSVIGLWAARALGAAGARLIKYTTSAETSGDYDSVVGYAGVIIA